uniref:Uncharacterized protein n=1 Tax=Panagrolaimus sp. PS1159 TaxID=55785 RepID=A0AC35GP31_9BILA
MDSLASSFASSKIVSTPIFYGKRAWPGGPSIQQNFLLPLSIIYYIAKNPLSTKVYQKLVKTCKFFFEKNPIIIFDNLDTLDNTTKYHISQNANLVCSQNNFECCVKADLKTLSTKIWITRGLHIHRHIENCVAGIVQKNFRFEILRLVINDNDIIFDDLKYLASYARRVTLWINTIKYKNGSIVMLDKILELFPSNIFYFSFYFGKEGVSMVNDSTMKNILKLQNLQNLETFKMLDCPDTLNVEDLSAFIKKFENTEIFFCFDTNLSQEYKEQLDSLIDEVIESHVPKRIISYPGQNGAKFKILISRFSHNVTVPVTIPGENEVEDLENNDGFDAEAQHVEDEPTVDDKFESDETETDAGSTCCIAFLFNKIKNFFKST